MPGFFDPLPKGELDLDQIKQWVQNNVDTFHRSISMQGTLFSADFVDGTTGWRLNPDGTAQFNEDVDIGGANTTNAQLFIHNTLQHVNLLENDGTDYPNHQFIIDVNADTARMFWRDSSGAPVSTTALTMLQDGTVNVATGPLIVDSGDATAPAIQPDGDDDSGIFFAAGAVGLAIAGVEVARFNADGLRGIAVEAASNVDDRTFTNTGFLDLDALTGGSGTVAAVATSVVTLTTAWVIVTGTLGSSGGTTVLGYRVSGATTIASTATLAARIENAANQEGTYTFQHVLTGLTPGTNVFELQALVTAGTGRILSPSLTVIPLGV